jgi:hypothetical protein
MSSCTGPRGGVLRTSQRPGGGAGRVPGCGGCRGSGGCRAESVGQRVSASWCSLRVCATGYSTDLTCVCHSLQSATAWCACCSQPVAQPVQAPGSQQRPPCPPALPATRCPCRLDGLGGGFCNVPVQQTCVNQCSGHGECYSGYCRCYSGWYGHDCAMKKAGLPIEEGGSRGAWGRAARGEATPVHVTCHMLHALPCSAGSGGCAGWYAPVGHLGS